MTTSGTPAADWPMIHRARAALAQDLAGLTPGQWRQATLCSAWDVEHVVAHLTAAATTTRWAWLRSIAAARFRPDVHNDRSLQSHLGDSPAETLAQFRGAVDSTTAPTGDLAAWLGEVVVHGEDVRRPLGLPDRSEPEALAAVAAFYASRDFAVNSATAVKGLRLVSTDGPFTAGEGPLVEGPTMPLVMAMAGRTQYLEHLSGPGVATLRERLATSTPRD